MADGAGVKRASDGDDWARLQGEYVELRIAVQQEGDPARKAEMIEQLRTTREAISDLDEARAAAAEAALAEAEAEAAAAAASAEKRGETSTVARDRALSIASEAHGDPDDADGAVSAEADSATVEPAGTIGNKRLLLVLAVSITVVAIGLVLYGALAGGGGGNEPTVVDGDAAAGDSDAESGIAATALQVSLDRLVGATPIRFADGDSGLSELSRRILNSVIQALQGRPDEPVTIVGLGGGADAEALGLARARAVAGYLVDNGIDSARLSAIADAADGPPIAGDGQIGFLVDRSAGAVGQTADGLGGGAVGDGGLVIAVVADNGSDPVVARSLVAAARGLARDRSGVEVVVTSTDSADGVVAAVSGYAGEGHGLVVVHGAALTDDLRAVVAAHPETAFAWAAGSDAFDLPNLYKLDVAAEQGAFVLGALSAHLTSSGTIAVVGSVDGGDAGRFASTFHDAAHLESPLVKVTVASTGGTADGPAAAEIARSQVAEGADVMAVSGDVAAAVLDATAGDNVVWLAAAEDLSTIAPTRVAASQVYHWEVALEEVVDDIEADAVAGHPLTLTMANGGLAIVYNEKLALPPEVRLRVDQLVTEIVDGTIVVG